ncbi:type VI secretion ATPase, ClpV1 family [Serratia fonticola]|uniref:Type VI secretion ATPase, ClpV1 family n=1 Tax=Serratia fonticola TaxID=47917 RepID=A0A3S4XJR2_SERFO|nr:type VI secretion ATPase, ClpV1 family [Serratia fonticola]
MIQIDLPTLVNRLNPIARHALEAAAAHCVSLQEAEVTVSQVLMQMVASPLSDVRVILNHAGVDTDALRESLDQRISGYQSVTQAYPSFSLCWWSGCRTVGYWRRPRWITASCAAG